VFPENENWPSSGGAIVILVTGGAGFIGSNFVLDWVTETGGATINRDKLRYAGNLGNLKSMQGHPATYY
jgi:dTDP-glucose 4,6-dehydratase